MKLQYFPQCIFGWNLPINAFDDFSQTAQADDNTPNATEDCVKKKLYMEQKKPQKCNPRKSPKITIPYMFPPISSYVSSCFT